MLAQRDAGEKLDLDVLDSRNEIPVPENNKGPEIESNKLPPPLDNFNPVNYDNEKYFSDVE